MDIGVLMKGNWHKYRASHQVTKLLSEVMEFQGNWEKENRLRPEIVTSLQSSAIITSAGSSTRIEGSILTDDEVEDLIKRGCKVTSLSSRSEREVAGYIKCIELIFGNYESDDLSEHFIRSLHQLLCKDLTESELPINQRGVYKNIANNVVEIDEKSGQKKILIEMTPPGLETEQGMISLISRFHELDNIPYVLRVGLFVVDFLKIHPFRDGNGRMARLLTNFLLLKKCPWVKFVSHEKFIEDNKEAYYVSLNRTQREFENKPEAYDYWLQFYFEILTKQIKFLKFKISQATTKTQKNNIDLNKNELLVVSALREKGILSASELIEVTKMSKDGMKKLLKRLTDSKILLRVGKGPATKYQL